jgi:hypothetical protein
MHSNLPQPALISSLGTLDTPAPKNRFGYENNELRIIHPEKVLDFDRSKPHSMDESISSVSFLSVYTENEMLSQNRKSLKLENPVDMNLNHNIMNLVTPTTSKDWDNCYHNNRRTGITSWNFGSLTDDTDLPFQANTAFNVQDCSTSRRTPPVTINRVQSPVNLLREEHDQFRLRQAEQKKADLFNEALLSPLSKAQQQQQQENVSLQLEYEKEYDDDSSFSSLSSPFAKSPNSPRLSSNEASLYIEEEESTSPKVSGQKRVLFPFKRHYIEPFPHFDIINGTTIDIENEPQCLFPTTCRTAFNQWKPTAAESRQIDMLHGSLFSLPTAACENTFKNGYSGEVITKSSDSSTITSSDIITDNSMTCGGDPMTNTGRTSEDAGILWDMEL